ncbi:MAG: 2-amino-4-hydroxy-6-hydroxymethyldihydropteridine diphosphokinase [Phycisphaeraceae bacterium]
MTRVYIGMGSNVGDRAGHLAYARDALAALPGTALAAMSRVIQTPPLGPVEQGDYLNAAAALDTELEPAALLDHLRRIERVRGRPPEEQRVKWGPRTLDLDILLYGDRVLTTQRLTVPHPHMHERRFVLEPLAEIGATAVHPVLHKEVGTLLKELEEKS